MHVLVYVDDLGVISEPKCKMFDAMFDNGQSSLILQCYCNVIL